MHCLDEREQTFSCGQDTKNQLDPSGQMLVSELAAFFYKHESLTQHLLLFLGGCCSQHGGGQGFLPLHMNGRLGCLETRRGSRLALRKKKKRTPDGG
jgi:hypothetical protein